MAKLIFAWYLITGTVQYQQTVDGHKQYALFFKDGKVVDYAYKAEILEYIETKTFEYNEDLEK
jgi:leucyl aminopeptidase (aminopeptidase T)